MNTSIKTVIVTLFLVSTVTHTVSNVQGQNLLINGSFELPGQAGVNNHWAFFPGGATNIPGWTASLNGVEYYDFTAASFGTGFSYFGVAQDGAFIVDLAPYTFTGGAIQQEFATIPGTNYEVSFYVGTLARDGRNGTAHGVVSAANTTNAFAYTNTSGLARWEPRSFSFTATSTNTTLRFSSTANPFLEFVVIDNVSVVSQAAPVTVELGFFPGILVRGRIGRTYAVEYVESLTSTNWLPLDFVTLQATSQRVFDTTSPGRTNRFYRAVEIP